MASDDMIRESQDPSTAAARLAELARIDRDLWPAIAVHPAAYPALLDWLGEQGDPTVNAVLALRSGPPAPTATPAGPPPPPAATPAAAAPSPSASSTGGTTSTGDNNKNLWFVCGMVVVVLALIGGIAFGATKVFGGDDDDKDEASPSQTIDAPEPSDPPTVEAPELSDRPSAGPSAAAFCEAFDGVQEVLAGSPDATPGSGTVKTVANILDNAETLAPAEIKDDIGVMADYFTTLSDPTLDPSTLTESAETFAAAGKRASAYYAANCM